MACPSDQSVSVVRADHHDGERDLAAADRALVRPLGRVHDGVHVPAPGAQHVPADDGRQLERPDQPGRQPRARRLVEGRAEEVPALLERVGDRDQDVLAVDQQVGQVVGDEVAAPRSAAARPRSRRPRRPG